MSILQKIQSELKAPKSQYNKFGKYNYRSLEDIMEALKPILAKHSASLIVGDDIHHVYINDTQNRVYVKATATLYDKDMKVIATNTAYARESESKKGMDDSQITGSTSSYARKYCLNGMFCIDDTKDADATNKHGKEEEKKEQKTSADYETLVDQHGTVESLTNWWKKTEKEIKRELNETEYNKLVNYCKSVKETLSKPVPKTEDDVPLFINTNQPPDDPDDDLNVGFNSMEGNND